MNPPSWSVLASVTVNISFKLWDIHLASPFIVNKSQLVVKWKQLEAVLKHAYRVFYPGSRFHQSSYCGIMYF